MTPKELQEKFFNDLFQLIMTDEGRYLFGLMAREQKRYNATMGLPMADAEHLRKNADDFVQTIRTTLTPLECLMVSMAIMSHAVEDFVRTAPASLLEDLKTTAATKEQSNNATETV